MELLSRVFQLENAYSVRYRDPHTSRLGSKDRRVDAWSVVIWMKISRSFKKWMIILSVF